VGDIAGAVIRLRIADCGMRNAECGLTRPSGLALRAACGCLTRSAQLRILECGIGELVLDGGGGRGVIYWDE
jgi:hypothetical protein